MTRTKLIALLETEMAAHRDARSRDDGTSAWRALERAHIVSQPMLAPHMRVHVAMLGYAVHLRDGREVVGQIVRLALAPLGFLTGRIPWGNTGRSDVSAFQPMLVPEDLRSAIETEAKS
ncbi:hypothetical protein ASE86_07620 [Sphingomonas sp. Leaf33]|uniref:DUF3703 domain-containing protein n=1 Tax=Sphingomonas sp. Leaf33 TaxID=1736215 RepID=UPI0006F34D77|nr:DUF3703 domain-containing protein [Sphingomonas sp. Leaf33]KQN26026.1 hypothetical protein ASE86_07620 [Sphingomonas sp. Leaf33]